MSNGQQSRSLEMPDDELNALMEKLRSMGWTGGSNPLCPTITDRLVSEVQYAGYESTKRMNRIMIENIESSSRLNEEMLRHTVSMDRLTKAILWFTVLNLAISAINILFFILKG